MTAEEARSVQAVVFDLDGVITDTARVHAAAWKTLFDEYLMTRSVRNGKPFSEFLDSDYRSYLDGKPRYEGVETFLASREITLPHGTVADHGDCETICGLGNRKDRFFMDAIERFGAKVFESTVTLVRDLRLRGIPVAVASSSRNCERILQRAGIRNLFDVSIDGAVAEALALRGKPEPDTFLKCLELLGAVAKQAVVVEDAISGVEAGRRAAFGLVLAVDRGGQREALVRAGAHVVVSDLDGVGADDLKAWLRSAPAPAMNPLEDPATNRAAASGA